MATYVIGAVLSVKDPEKFAAYQQAAAVALYGGKILGGGTNIEVADGTWSPIGMVVIEFETMAKAKAKEWYTSPEYNAVKSGRLDNTDSGLVFLDAG